MRGKLTVLHIDLSSVELGGISVDFRLKSKTQRERKSGYVYLNDREGKTKIACSETQLSHVHQNR
jgi:hypothetical protein